MTELNKFKLRAYKSRFGIMTSMEAFTLAVDGEQFAKQCGVCDPAFEHFAQQRISFEAYAYLLAEEEQENDNA